MIVVVLAEDDIIEGALRVAGQVVTVDDAYTNVRRVLRKLEEETDRNTESFFVQGLRKLQAILQRDYPDFWAVLENRPAVRQTIIQELRDQPQFLRRALNDPAWFVAQVQKRLSGAK